MLSCCACLVILIIITLFLILSASLLSFSVLAVKMHCCVYDTLAYCRVVIRDSQCDAEKHKCTHVRSVELNPRSAALAALSKRAPLRCRYGVAVISSVGLTSRSHYSNQLSLCSANHRLNISSLQGGPIRWG